MLDAPFAPGLRAFFTALADADWPARVPSCVFIRDFDSLPESAPFDIDLVCNRNDWPKLRALVRECAGGLIVSETAAEQALYILLIDLEGPADTHRHAFLEVRDTLAVPSRQFAVTPAADISLGAADIPRTGEHGLPQPPRDWHAAFTLLQALRKSDTAKYLSRYRAFDAATRESAQDLLSGRMGFPAGDIENWLAAPAPRPRGNKGTPAPAPRDTHEKLRRFCADRLFFLPLLKLDFFTIHGPDGAGKSTTCAEIARLIEGLPFGLHQFHHSEGWKEGRRRDPRTGQVNKPQAVAATAAQPSLLRRIARGAYRLMPEGMREFWLWNSHFVNYNRKFTRFLLDNRNSGYILFADRYVYDVRIKYIVETEHPSWLVLGYYRLHCALVPKPRYGFVLVDDPAKIVARKDELTEEQVTRFIGWIMRILRERRMPHTVVPIDGRPPRAVAAQIACELIERQGEDLIRHMRTFVSEIEAAEEDSAGEPAPLRAAV